MTRIVIFANGNLDRPDLVKGQLRLTDRIFCADGGTHHALALGLKPEVIVGDLDSFSPKLAHQLEAQGTIIHRHPANKDQTDLELALALAAAERPAEILLLAVLGGRLDQMLANLLLLTLPDFAPIPISLTDGLQWGTLLRGPQQRTLVGHLGDTLSLIPLSASVEGVTISGVQWPLAEATLAMGSTWSISNTFVESSATVQIEAGLMLVIHLSGAV